MTTATTIAYPGAPLREATLTYDAWAAGVVDCPELLVEAAHLHPEWLARLAVEDPELYTTVGAERPDVVACCIAIRPDLLILECRTFPKGFLDQVVRHEHLLELVAGFNPMALVALFVDQPQILQRVAELAPAALERLRERCPLVLEAVDQHAPHPTTNDHQGDPE